MTRTSRKGRKKSRSYVDKAIALILDRTEPISTWQLIKILKLTEHEGISLRRGLKRKAEAGDIQKVTTHPDGSFTWLPPDVSLPICAGHAANLYLKRENAEFQIDPSKFARWVVEDMQQQG